MATKLNPSAELSPMYHFVTAHSLVDVYLAYFTKGEKKIYAFSCS